MDLVTPMALRVAATLRLADFQPKPAEVRQYLRPVPFIVTQRRPLVVVRGHAAQGDRGVDG